MNKNFKRRGGLTLILLLILSLVMPQIASAYTVQGDPANPSLTIQKALMDPASDDPNATTGIEGVEFTITQTHSFDPATNTWTEVTDAAPIKKMTDTTGQAVFTSADALKLGRYKVQETAAPPNVIMNPQVFTVDIPMTNQEGSVLNYDVEIAPKNELVRGNAELIKKGENGNRLPGVVFGLYAEDGTQIGSPLTTDAEGKITVENLEYGTYYFQELSTVEGYTLNNTPIYFEVTQNEEGSTVVWQDGEINTGNEVTNYEMPEIEKDVEGTDHFEADRGQEFTYNLTIKTPGDINKYAALGVKDILDDRLEYAGSWTVTGTDKSNITFSQDGQTLVWRVNDLSLLTPNVDVKISFTAKVRPDAVLDLEETGIPNTATLHFNNDNGSFTEPPTPDPEWPPGPPIDPPTTPPVFVDPTEGGMTVIKVDKADNSIRLEGAEFKLTADKAGEQIVDATGTVITVNGTVHNGLLENLVTDANGQIRIDGLTPGTYYLHETKAPTYVDDKGENKPYRLLTSPVEVTIVNDVGAAANEVTVENSKSGWELPTTGGMGTTLFTLIGFLLMASAMVIFFRRKEAAE